MTFAWSRPQNLASNFLITPIALSLAKLYFLENKKSMSLL